LRSGLLHRQRGHSRQHELHQSATQHHRYPPLTID
jgi:hypothetical protein